MSTVLSEYYIQKFKLGEKQREDDCKALMITERKPYRRLSKRGIQREIGIIAKKAGLHDKVSPHVIRHTFATLQFTRYHIKLCQK
jgi:integrase/recombinase XerD